MAYFSNSTEGEIYRATWCSCCVHDGGEQGCAVLLAHLLFNYDDCNKPNSILHMLIPRSKDGLENEQCRMFIARQVAP